MTLPRLAVVMSTTREGRFADRPMQWLLDIASQRDDATFEVVDLRDHPLPFFDEVASPMYAPVTNPLAQAFGDRMATFDGFIFITAEYNHGIPAVLKNALDYAYAAFNRKPAAFVGYGGVGGARAIEQLRLNALELQMAPLKASVHIGMVEYLGLLREGRQFEDYPHLAVAAQGMLDDLMWWTTTLAAGRASAALGGA